MDKQARLKLWLAIIAGLGAVIALGALGFSWRHLPEPMAIRHSIGGPPSAVPRGVALLIFALGTLLPAALSWPRDASPLGEQAPRTLGVIGFLSALVALVSVASVRRNWDHAAFNEVPALSAVEMLALTAVAAGIGWLLALVARRAGLAEERSSAEDSPLSLGDGERVFWVGSAANRIETALAIGLGVLGVVFFLRGPIRVGLALGLTAIVLEHVSRIRVTVSRERLVIHYGHLGLIRQSVRVADIVSASSFELIPIAHGGWGYRGSLKLMRRAAVVVRRGSALRLELVRNRQLAITVDDAKTGAELLSGLRQATAEA